MHNKISDAIRGILRWCFYLAFRARRGYGLPKSKERWEHLYSTGHWDYLDSTAELPHYMVAVGYTREFSERPSVLDLGCGHGRVLELLRVYPIGRYLGLDLSEEAIRRAGHLARSDAEFVVGDFEHFVPPQRYDVILFNECLAYARDPADVMRRYAGALTPGGVIVVSMCYNWWQFPIWTSLVKDFATLHRTAVTNEKGQTWHVRVLRARQELSLPAPASRPAGHVGSVPPRLAAAANVRARLRPIHLAFLTVVAGVATLAGFALIEAIEVFG